MAAPSPSDYSESNLNTRIPQDIHEAIGQSDAFLAFQERLSSAAHVNRPILLMGERGTGKELAASRIHFLSQRWEGPFVTLNCAALSPTLIESELFGHEAGAFTGAGGRRRGRFEAAEGGTLFLDEIGHIPLEVQAKILRVVEYGMFERVGSSSPIQVDVRIVGATNADLRTLAERGKFMRDLLDRLSFEVLILPPLRHRRGDIEVLANHFAARMGFELGLENIPEIAEDALEKLKNYAWPGNIRELKNVIERAVYRSADGIIRTENLVFDPFQSYSGEADKRVSEPDKPPAGALPAAANGPARLEDLLDLTRPFTECVQQLERELLQRALEDTKYNQRKAAEKLGLTYHQFRGIYRKYQGEGKGKEEKEGTGET